MARRWDIFVLGLLGLLVICFAAFAVWWWFIRKPPLEIGKPCIATEKGTVCLSNGFLAAIEKTSDESMPTPLTMLKLQNFDYGSGYPPWCIPSFYAFRYVDSDGNYGELSSWFGPVVAQPTATPGGCWANLPNLVVQDTTDPNLNKYYSNVHRQDSVLNESSEGKVVGMLAPVVYEFVDDPDSNPNISGKTSCKKYGC